MDLTVQTVAITCFALLAVGYGVFLILGQNAKLAPTVKDVWPILHTETLIVGAAAGSFWIGGWVLSIALLIHAWRVMFEATSVINIREDIAAPAWVGFGFVLLCLLGSLISLGFLAVVCCLGMLAIAAIIYFETLATDARTDAISDLILFPALPLFLFTVAGLQGGFGVWLLAAFLLVETFDGYALLGGKLFGRRKAFPTLSPNKTIEGLAIVAAMLMLTAALAGAVLAGLPLLASAGIALLAGALTLAGDLSASRLKRLSGVKDFPVILKRQGGLFDITDAWITTGAGLVCLALVLGLV